MDSQLNKNDKDIDNLSSSAESDDGFEKLEKENGNRKPKKR